MAEELKDKLLKADGEELSRLLGEVLQPEKNKHSIPHGSHLRGRCTKCGKDLDWSQWHKPCGADNPVDPIVLDDWNVAMKRRDWAAKECRKSLFMSALWDVYYTEGGVKSLIAFTHWLAYEAKPKHYLIAAAICKLKGDSNART